MILPSLSEIPLIWIQSTIFFFGLCVGSFLNVVIYRLPLEKSIVFPRSSCPKCQTLIPWWANVPLLSYVFLRARCASCKGPISLRYPFVELLTGVLFLLGATAVPDPLAWPFVFYFLASLVACTFIDLDHWLLPDKITIPGMVVGILGSFFLPQHDWLNAVLGILFGGGLLFSVAWLYLGVTGKDGLGGGDIKFLAMAGAFLGWKGAFVTILFGSFVGSILGIFLMLIKGKKGTTAIPFGPFLCGGALLAFFFGEPLWRWYFRF